MFHEIISFQRRNRLYFPQLHGIFLVFWNNIFDIRITFWLEFMTQIEELLWNTFKPVSTLFQSQEKFENFVYNMFCKNHFTTHSWQSSWHKYEDWDWWDINQIDFFLKSTALWKNIERGHLKLLDYSRKRKEYEHCYIYLSCCQLSFCQIPPLP